MHPHLHPKVRRFLTEPDESNTQSLPKNKRKTLRELKLTIYNGPQLNEINVPNLLNIGEGYQKNGKVVPLHYKRMNKKAHLYKLPQLSNENVSNVDYIDTQTNKNAHGFKRSNPLFILNSLFQIIKEDLPENSTKKQNISNEQQKKVKDIKSQKSTITSNQFGQFEPRNIRFKRPPRIVNNHMNRMTSKENFCQRRIYSQEKTRNKQQKDVKLVTFYNCSDNLEFRKGSKENFQRKECIFGEN